MKNNVRLLPQEALQYPDEWVCFSSDLSMVVSHGKTPMEASDKAMEVGHPDAVLHYVENERERRMIHI